MPDAKPISDAELREVLKAIEADGFLNRTDATRLAKALLADRARVAELEKGLEKIKWFAKTSLRFLDSGDPLDRQELHAQFETILRFAARIDALVGKEGED